LPKSGSKKTKEPKQDSQNLEARKPKGLNRNYQILDEAGEMIECRSELLLCVLNGDFIQLVTGGMSTSFQQSKFHEISWKFLL
jgi:hypothetical protein